MNFVLLLWLCPVGFSFLWHKSFKCAVWCFHNYGVLPILFFRHCFYNICCSYGDGLVIPLLNHVQTLGRMGILCHCCWEIYCNINMQMARDHPIPDHWVLKTVHFSVHLRKLWAFSILELPWGWNGLENNLLIPSWAHASLRALFFNFCSIFTTDFYTFTFVS